MEGHEDIVQGILNYLNMPSSGALLITGVWGCGKTYFLKEELFPFLKDEHEKNSIMVSLYGIKEISELPNKIVSSYLDKLGSDKNVKPGKFVDWCGDLSEAFPFLKNYVDINKIICKTNTLLYKFIPQDTIIFLDDLERAVASIDINEILGTINELVENNKYKVIVVANKGYIDEIIGNEKVVFYEKVIEKSLTFLPDLISIYKHLLGGYNDTHFWRIMFSEKFKEIVNPLNAITKSQMICMQNIRTLKFAISHMYVLFNKYKNLGRDLDDVKIQEYILNQWKFIYGLSIELKKDKLTLDNSQGLSTYNEFGQLSIDLEGPVDNLFEVQEDEGKDEIEANFASKFCQKYYRENYDHFIFYPELYNFIVGGIDFDANSLFINTQKQMARFEYRDKPAQEVLDRMMKGIWYFSESEARQGLCMVLDAVSKGQLEDLISYYNASYFLLQFAKVIGKEKEEILSLFEVGIKEFASKLDISDDLRIDIDMIEAPKGYICEPVYQMLRTALDERLKAQEKKRVEELEILFNENMELFVQQLVLGKGMSPALADVPILHVFSPELINQRVSTLEPSDLYNLNTMVKQRPQTLGRKFVIERMFYEDLHKAILTRRDENSISGFVISNILLKTLEKVLHDKVGA